MNTEETWRPVVGYEGLYVVSDRGRVRRCLTSRGSFTGRLLKATPSFGYPRVCLMKDRKRSDRFVHGLVMEAFIGPKPPGYEVHHKDGERDDPSIENLEYLLKDTHLALTAAQGLTRGEKNPRAKLTEADVVAIRAADCRKGRLGDVHWAALAERFGVSIHTIRAVRERSVWKHLE